MAINVVLNLIYNSSDGKSAECDIVLESSGFLPIHFCCVLLNYMQICQVFFYVNKINVS